MQLEETQTSLRPAAAAEPKKARVLVVDDDSVVRRLVRDGLEREGFDVTEAGDGAGRADGGRTGPTRPRCPRREPTRGRRLRHPAPAARRLGDARHLVERARRRDRPRARPRARCRRLCREAVLAARARVAGASRPAPRHRQPPSAPRVRRDHVRSRASRGLQARRIGRAACEGVRPARISRGGAAARLLARRVARAGCGSRCRGGRTLRP